MNATDHDAVGPTSAPSGQPGAAAVPSNDGPGERNAALIRERMARHVGTLAYIYGYPIVDMRRQMHNETHVVASGQQVLASLDRFYAYEYLVTPTTAGNLRVPNNDTLYFGAWFDLATEPRIIHAPDTAGRYYTMAITDFYAESHHVGRRTTGTGERYFALVGPNWDGELPPYVHRVNLPTPQVWILGRMMVDGERDFHTALALIKAFWAAPLSQFRPGVPPAPPAPPQLAAALEPLGTLQFYAELNDWLRRHPGEPGEAALMDLFDQIGIGPHRSFDAETIDAATRCGLEAAISDGEAMVLASTQRPLRDLRNGWIFTTGFGRYGSDYLMRASVVKGGYANAAEESTYAAKVFDDEGRLLDGSRRYHWHLDPEQIPPAGAFWSLAAYDLQTQQLIENPLRRYSLGDRTQGLLRNADGSLDFWIQRDEPAAGTSNWLPVGAGAFMLVLRIYEPGPAIFDGSYKPGRLRVFG
ncbi:MAG: DUF1254 domain-containing protein [Burkholderiales bacterium]|nr:DUF1214 domain-containing protein [Burkholderiales bacterium]MDE1926429.1 DUF1254 domain-containing protein [Burkholderiales bacterium]MDE2158495.1 DUF1254 domain-containing protein [Burkholderiales bacterium]MDE2503808.1 DUF1254 domain-containing protein [Burkholderiales bacterium]